MGWSRDTIAGQDCQQDGTRVGQEVTLRPVHLQVKLSVQCSDHHQDTDTSRESREADQKQVTRQPVRWAFVMASEVSCRGWQGPAGGDLIL